MTGALFGHISPAIFHFAYLKCNIARSSHPEPRWEATAVLLAAIRGRLPASLPRKPCDEIESAVRQSRRPGGLLWQIRGDSPGRAFRRCCRDPSVDRRAANLPLAAERGGPRAGIGKGERDRWRGIDNHGFEQKPRPTASRKVAPTTAVVDDRLGARKME